MVSVHMREQNGTHALPIEAKLGHLQFEWSGIFVKPRIDEYQTLRRLDDISDRRRETSQDKDPRHNRRRVSG